MNSSSVAYKPNTSEITFDDKVQTTRQQVSDLTDIMRQNINLALDREQKLEDLDRRADTLNVESGQFQYSARKIKRFACLKNLKWTIILIVTIVVILAIIIGLSVGYSNYQQNQTKPTPKPNA